MFKAFAIIIVALIVGDVALNWVDNRHCKNCCQCSNHVK